MAEIYLPWAGFLTCAFVTSMCMGESRDCRRSKESLWLLTPDTKGSWLATGIIVMIIGYVVTTVGIHKGLALMCCGGWVLFLGIFFWDIPYRSIDDER